MFQLMVGRGSGGECMMFGAEWDRTYIKHKNQGEIICKCHMRMVKLANM